jgi:anti-sigma-K factor RskA
MTRDECRQWREDIGAYLLGGLPEDRRTALLAHLDGCAGCRAELAELAEVARVLPAADPLRNHERQVPSQELFRSILGAIAGERRERRVQLTKRVAAAAAAAAVLALGAVTIVTLQDDSSRATVELADTAGDAISTASLEYLPGGTRIDLRVDGLPEEETFFVWLEDSDGERVPAGTFWTPDEGGKIELKLTAALSLRRCEGIGISDSDGETVLYSTVEWDEPRE